MKLIETEGLQIAYHGHTVLSSVNMSIERGEIVTIVGPNGSGKSSLLRALIRWSAAMDFPCKPFSRKAWDGM